MTHLGPRRPIRVAAKAFSKKRNHQDFHQGLAPKVLLNHR